MKTLASEAVGLAIDFAGRGDFREAIETLGDRWLGVGVEPGRADESDVEFARLLLACGILTVEIGRFEMLPAQAGAKDLLSMAVRLFGDDPRRNDARFWLGVAYCRCGENSEALALVDTILREQTANSDVIFCAGRLQGLAFLNLGRLAESEQAFESVAVFLPVVPPMARGRFLLSRGMLSRQRQKFDEALACYEQAIQAFRLAGSLRHEAAAQNNIAGVYIETERYSEALEVAQGALTIFAQMGDRAHEAKVWDQLAQIHGQLENFVEMERCSGRAVEILSAGDHEGWLVEALTTHGTALANLGMQQAMESMTQAIAICGRLGNDVPDRLIPETYKLLQSIRGGIKTLGKAVSPLERDVYRSVLAEHGGRVTPTAHALGLKHQVLQRRLQKHFPELLKECRPKRIRRKSIFKKE